MQNVIVRRATAHDADRLTAVVRSSGAYRGEYAAMVVDHRVTAEYTARHEVFAAVDADDRILGFYSLVLEPAELDLAFVTDEAQGLGIGRLLIDHMLVRARAAGAGRVRVVSHPPSEAFYRRLGAERTGTVPAAPPTVTWARPELHFRTT
ncbi:GNAT family N-acetyltransferase [Streptomyces sp. NPDC057939]|uniref:GNAT family N-acetyltransferase n=1 Tax=Streptomyces sp. NPDC057939 TaxID=3346284 RepID=UPI0036E7412D